MNKKNTNNIVRDNECIMCNKSIEQFKGKKPFFFKIHDQYIYFCPEHEDSFRLGLSLGQIELNKKMVGYLTSLDEPIKQEELRKAIFQLAPNTRVADAKRTSKNSEIAKTCPKTPADLYDQLGKYVVGQELAKSNISVAVIQHLWRLDQPSSHVPDKYNILLLGPSGSGKTLLANSVAQCLKLPFAAGDATNYSPTGFHGADADSIVHELMIQTELDRSAAETGVLFIDELDKLASYHNNGSRSETLNFGTQSTLLKLIEGKTVKVPGPLFGEPMGTSTDINTHNMLFFFGGAFNGLADIVGKLSGHTTKKMGFRTYDLKEGELSQQELEEAIKSFEIYSKAAPDVMYQALIDYGLLAELVGRIPVVAPLRPLSTDELRDCLLKLEHSPIRKQELIFNHSGYRLEFTDELLEAIVNMSHKMATGTRSLSTLVKKVTSVASFKYLTIDKASKVTKRIIFNKQCLTDPNAFSIESLSSKKDQATLGISTSLSL